jgi:hypothetical protein
MAALAFDSNLQISNELEHGLRVEGLEEIRLIKDKRTGMFLRFEEWLSANLRLKDNHGNLPLLSSWQSPKQDDSSKNTILTSHSTVHTIRIDPKIPKLRKSA